MNGVSYTDAAEVLGITEGMLTSRWIETKRAFVALTEPFLLPSQRGPRRSDVGGWLKVDDSGPDYIRPLLGALRDRLPAMPEDKERIAGHLFEG